MTAKLGAPTPIEITITYLEMHAPPTRPPAPAPLGKLAILRAERPTVSFYRYLYNTIGEPWNWVERRLLDDDALRAIIHDDKIDIYVLHVGGVPAGYVEQDRRHAREIEIAYFGLVPDFVGRGLGSYFLDWAVSTAWLHKPKRVWVNTCSLDHPRALSVYQRAGFVPYDRRVDQIMPMSAVKPRRSRR